MGSGKSTMGQMAADALQVNFFDTDVIIESQAGMTISGIFSTQGEDAFRELEADILRQSIIYDKALISTGGGTPCYFDNMQWMNDHGITMYLYWPDDLLKAHLLKQMFTRPLLEHLPAEEAEDKIALLLSERKPYYEMAAMTIEMEGNLEKDLMKLKNACRYIW